MLHIKIVLTFIVMSFLVSTSAQKAKGKGVKWEVVAELPSLFGNEKSLGFAGPVTGVHHNVLLIGGGANFPGGMPWQGGKKKYYDDVYVYIMNKNSIRLFENRFKLPLPVAYAAVCSTTQGIVYAGGENENGLSNKVFLLEWDNSTESIISKPLPYLPMPLTNAAAVFLNERVYLAGGETRDVVSNKIFSLDLDNLTAGWKELCEMPKPMSHIVFLANKNKLYLAGGRKKNTNGISDLYNSVFEFNISTNQWKEMQPLPFAVSAGTGVVFKNKLYLFGGDKGETFHKTEILIAEINAEKEEKRKANLILQKNELQFSHPGFSKDVLMFNLKENTWKSVGHIPFDSPVTTTAVQWNKWVLIPSGEIKAGVRTPQILKTKL